MADAQTVEVSVERHGDPTRGDQPDWLTVEAPLEIRVNGAPFTVTMRTPGQDEDLALGLLFTEGILVDSTVRPGLHPAPCGGGVHDRRMDVTVDPELIRWRGPGRSLMSSSSCGLCGKTSMEELELEASPVRDHGALDGELVPRLQRLMRSRQAGFDRSGGVHAAAAFTLEGELLAVCEDIGRHNAVDKVIGALLREETLDQAAAMTVSGRVSFEIVSKAARANIQHLIAVSAPSSMAVEMCAAHGMTLIGFCREGRFTTYSHPGGISWERPHA